VGLFTGLLTLPLAPARGVMWVLEQVVEEAERQMYDEQSIRRELLELELEFDEGKLDADERERREQELLDRLADSRLRSQDPAGVWDG
jgi:hypothetical protein